MVANDITPISSGLTVPPTGVVDRWQQLLAPCKPTLTMVSSLRPVREWLAGCKKQNGPVFFDADRYAKLSYVLQDRIDRQREERLAIIPETAILLDAKSLFHAAEHVPAPRNYLRLGIGVYLASMPNAANVNAAEYLCGVVDMLAGDDEVSGSFSVVAFACAIREVKRTNKFVASPAEILDVCQSQRKRFHDLGNDIEMLLWVRENAEEVLQASRACYPSEDWDHLAPAETVRKAPPIGPDDYTDVPF